jgi:hypothetical protein
VIWLGRAIPLPEAVSASLEVLLEVPVRHVRIFEHSLFVRLHGPAIATTRPGRIYLRGSGADFFQNPWLMLHEYWHVIKQWEPRTLTIRSYLVECARRGYWNNRFEVEARTFADAHANRLRAMLAQQRLAVIQPAGDVDQSRSQRERGAH